MFLDISDLSFFTLKRIGTGSGMSKIRSDIHTETLHVPIVTIQLNRNKFIYCNFDAIKNSKVFIYLKQNKGKKTKAKYSDNMFFFTFSEASSILFSSFLRISCCRVLEME